MDVMTGLYNWAERKLFPNFALQPGLRVVAKILDHHNQLRYFGYSDAVAGQELDEGQHVVQLYKPYPKPCSIKTDQGHPSSSLYFPTC